MDVRLKVLVGPNAGRELPVAGPKFLVGRAEDCQLRPRSDLISRHHCVLLIEEGMVAVRDFGSKNGTLVNGARVRGECELKNGDKLVIGPLEFEVTVRVNVANKKRPKVESIKEAATRTAEGSGAVPPMDDVDQWVQQDETEGAAASTETRRFNLNETEEIDLKNSETHVGPLPVQQPVTPHAKGAKSAPGKLPSLPSSKDSGQAATDVLNKFFKRR